MPCLTTVSGQKHQPILTHDVIIHFNKQLYRFPTGKRQKMLHFVNIKIITQ